MDDRSVRQRLKGFLLDQAKQEKDIAYATSPSELAEVFLCGEFRHEVVIHGKTYLEFETEKHTYLVQKGMDRD